MDRIYTMLQLLQRETATSQREIAKKSGFSLGMVNTLIKTMQERGLLTIHQHNNKAHYVLSDKGTQFLDNLMRERQLTKQVITRTSAKRVNKAVILAAGKKCEFPDVPVDLLPIEDEVCAFSRLIALLHEQDIFDITVIVGNRKELYQELYHEEGITFVENTQYLWSGSMLSLACASEQIHDDFVLLECDHVFEKRILAEILENEQDTCLVARSMSTEGNDCLVELDSKGDLFRISKDIRQLNHVDCILTGIHKISYQFYQKMLGYFKGNQNLLLNYEYVIETMARYYRVPILYLDDVLCWDMNSQTIYTKVCNQYYKKILKREQTLNEHSLKQLFSSVMGLDESNVVHIAYAGGMTNMNYKVKCEDGFYILRMPGKCTEEMISRSSEKYNSKIGYLLGINVDTIYFDEIRGIKITRYVEKAETLSPRTARLADNMKQTSTLLRKLHTSNAELQSDFNVFREYQKYETLIDSLKGTYYPGFDEIRKEFFLFQTRLERIGLEYKACHNDLVAENFIKNEKRMYLIDWEYAGMNDPMWDVAAHLLECEFSAEEEELFLHYYFEGDICTKVHRQKILIFKICQDVLWSTWTIAKEMKGEDFGTYGLDRLHRAQRNICEYKRIYEKTV